MKFLVDVCVSRDVTEYLRNAGHATVLVHERDPRLGDEDILQWAYEDDCVLITNDKDFGRYIFLHCKPCAGLIRLPNAEGRTLVALMRQVLANHEDDLDRGAIITATTKRIRVRTTRQE